MMHTPKATLNTTTAAAALAAYDSAVASGSHDELVNASHLLAAALRKPKAPAKPKAVKGPTDVFNAENLAAALGRMASIVPTRFLTPIMAYVLLEAKNGVLSITGTDMDMQYTERLKDCGLDDGFATAAQFRPLLKAVKGLKGLVMLEIAHGPGGPKLVVESEDGIKVTIPVLPAQDFPRMGFGKKASQATYQGDALAEAFSFVLGSVSTEETRYYLNGAYLNTCPDGAHLVSTDGHRLTEAVIPNAFSADIRAIIPSAPLAWMVSHLRGLLDDVHLVFDASTAPLGRLKLPNGELRFKTIDGSYPDYNRVVPKEADITARLTVENPEAAIALLKRAASQTTEKAQAVKIEMVGGKVTMSARNMEGGGFEAPFPGTFEGPDCVVGINSRYVVYALSLDPTGAVIGFNTTPPAPPEGIDQVEKAEAEADEGPFHVNGPILVTFNNPALATRRGVLMPLRV